MARVYTSNEPPHSQYVKQITIDSLNLDHCDLMKIDVETYECNVIEGAINTIEKYKPEIFLELHWEARDMFNTKIQPMLESLGYNIPSARKGKLHTMLHLTHK
jgi:hypothetical protein